MVKIIKSTVKKMILSSSGKFDYFKTTAQLPRKWYGNEYGGFFVCPDYLTENSIVYSFGIGEDISFDLDIVRNHGCSVFGFDPTPKSIAWINRQWGQLPKNFNFFEYGISDKSGSVDFFLPKNNEHVSGSFVNQTNIDDQRGIKAEMKSLADIVQQFGHSQIDVLKMDIEGAEYQVLQSILKSNIKINQLLVEFHPNFFPDGHEKAKATVKLLRDYGFEIFAVSDSFDEISFIHKTVMR